MDLSVLIVNWNAKEWLRNCLNSVYEDLRTCTGTNAQIYVVDNASSDGSVEMLMGQFPQVNLIDNAQNLGFAAANNQAIKSAEGQFLLLVNPDTLVHPGTIEKLIAHLRDSPQVGAVGPRILNPDGTIQVSAEPFPNLSRETWRLFHFDRLVHFSQYSKRFFQNQTAQAVDVLAGACILIRREVLERIGLLDEQFFVYSEEVDLCMRIRDAGWMIHWLPSATITHYGGRSTQLVADRMFIELYANKVRFFRKHYGELKTICYKWVLAFAALSRCMFCSMCAKIDTKNRKSWEQKNQQYFHLLMTLRNL